MIVPTTVAIIPRGLTRIKSASMLSTPSSFIAPYRSCAKADVPQGIRKRPPTNKKTMEYFIILCIHTS
jgi:hypothetical protein